MVWPGPPPKGVRARLAWQRARSCRPDADDRPGRTSPAPLASRRELDCTMSLEQVLEVLRARRNGSGWVALCPAHPDKNPSLSISEGDDGRVLLTCFAGCEFDAVRDAAGLEPSDLTPTRRRRTARASSPPTTTPTRTARSSTRSVGWSRSRSGNGARPRTATRGSSAMFVVSPTGSPSSSTVSRAAGGSSSAKARRTRRRSATAGFVATCNAGARASGVTSGRRCSRGAKVAILPDNDEPGRKHADEVAASLNLGAEVVKVITLGGLAEHGDVTDWFAAGGTAAALKDEITRARRNGYRRRSGVRYVRSPGPRCTATTGPPAPGSRTTCSVPSCSTTSPRSSPGTSRARPRPPCGRALDRCTRMRSRPRTRTHASRSCRPSRNPARPGSSRCSGSSSGTRCSR